jgi:hypothetical protein
VYAKNSITVENPNGISCCGLSSDGTTNGYDLDNPGSIRIWAGGTGLSGAPFKVTHGGYVFGTQFVTNGLKGRMDTQGFQFGDYSEVNYAFLHTNNNPLLTLKSEMGTVLEIRCSGGYTGTAIKIENTYSDNATFTLGYYRYSSETFGRPCITMTNPVYAHMITNSNLKDVVWDENSGKILVKA